MKTFELNFEGREVGVIGVTSHFKVRIAAKNIEAAWLKLYDTHEHITRKYWRVVPTARQIARTKSLLPSL